MDNKRLQDLFDIYLLGSMTRDELEELLNLLEECKDSDFDYLVDRQGEISQDTESIEMDKRAILHQILHQIEVIQQERTISPSWAYGKWAALIAACLLVVLGITYFNRESKEQGRLRDLSSNDIRLPEGAGPKIQRTDGKEFQIAPSSDGAILEEGLSITRDQKGNLLYKLSKATSALRESRTFISPKGSSSQLELEDGTRIWLNSGASVTYPSAFAPDQRAISVTGEVFLDVSPNKNRPFTIRTEQTQIRVLGTQFNVLSEKGSGRVVASLLEGSIEVQVGNRRKVLKPGFKSVSMGDGQDISVLKADMKSILAWKDGYFRFDDDPIETVMDKIREWYDIDQVSYRRKSNDEFSGMIKRTKSLSELLKQMEKISTYKFEIKDGRVLVM